MKERRWRLGAGALLAGCAAGCSSGSIPSTADASVIDAAIPPPVVDAAIPPDDVSPPPPADSGSADATGATDAADASDAAPDAGGCAWSGSYESPACASCLRAACCDAVTVCESDPQCVALDQCVSACLTTGGGDAGTVSNCAQSCADARPPAVRSEWQALSNCVEFQCANGGAGPCQ